MLIVTKIPFRSVLDCVVCMKLKIVLIVKVAFIILSISSDLVVLGVGSDTGLRSCIICY